MTKRFTIQWEDDKAVSIEIDGVRYTDPNRIPDPQDRAKALRVMAEAAGADDASEEDDSLDADDASEEDDSLDADDVWKREFGDEWDSEFRDLEQQKAWMPRMFLLIFGSVGLILLSVAVTTALRAGRASSREVSAPGEVVEMVARTDSEGNEYYYPVIEFNLADQTRSRVQVGEGSWPPAYAVGEKVIVLYDPARPRVARIKGGAGTIGRWLVPGITGFLGLIFLVVTFFARSFLRPELERAKEIAREAQQAKEMASGS